MLSSRNDPCGSRGRGTDSSLAPCGLQHHRGLTEPRWGALAEMDNSMRHMERQFRDLHRWMDSAWRDVGREIGFHNLFSYPLDMDPEALVNDVMRPQIVDDEEGKKKYRLNIHLGDNFPPENIRVGLKDRVMTIQAKMEQKSDDGNSRVYREVSRKFTLPENLDVKEVKSVMEPNGILKVEAPMPQQALTQAEPPQSMEIPIHLE